LAYSDIIHEKEGNCKREFFFFPENFIPGREWELKVGKRVFLC